MTFRDDVAEWRCLSKLTDTESAEWVQRLSPALFTGKRLEVFEAIQNAYALYGDVTFEALRTQLGVVPNELAAAQHNGNMRAIVDDLARLARKRQASTMATTLKTLADSHDPSLDQIQSSVLFEPIMAEEDSSLVPGARDFLHDLAQKRNGDYKLKKSGFQFLDNSMGGEWKDQTLVLYLGYPGSGKTTFTAQSMLSMAEGYVNETTGEKIVTPSLFISLEMPKKDILLKWLGNKLSIDTQDILAGRLTDQQFKLIEDTTVALQRLPMYIIDTPDITMSRIMYEIRKHVYRYGVKVVFIDYLQIMNYSATGQVNTDLGKIAEMMKSVAKREHITVVILSQITPGNDSTFRVRGSGEVGSHADLMLEASVEHKDMGAIKNVTIERTKNRLGPLGKSALLFNAPYQRFEEGETY